MAVRKRATDRSFADRFGETDFAKVDAHEIQPHEYDEIPELTDEMMQRSVRSNGADDLTRVVKSLLDATLTLDGDVAAALRATGSGWEQRGNAALREWLQKRSA